MKPCPFCESTDLFVPRILGGSWFHVVECRRCGAQGPHAHEVVVPTVTETPAVAQARTAASADLAERLWSNCRRAGC